MQKALLATLFASTQGFKSIKALFLLPAQVKKSKKFEFEFEFSRQKSFICRDEPLMNKKRHCSHKFSVTSNATQLTDISLADHPDTITVEDGNRPVFARSISSSGRSVKRRKSMQTVKEDNESSQATSEILRGDEQVEKLIREDVR